MSQGDVGAGAAGTSLTPMQLDRAIGAVVASAAGDALGSAYEFGPGLGDDQLPVFGVGVFGHERGEWTDDTAMAMPILEALAHGDSLLDPRTLASIVSRWLEWSATAKDVGAQTRSVLGSLGGDCSEGPLAGQRERCTSGPGGVPGTAPSCAPDRWPSAS